MNVETEAIELMLTYKDYLGPKVARYGLPKPSKAFNKHIAKMYDPDELTSRVAHLVKCAYEDHRSELHTIYKCVKSTGYYGYIESYLSEKSTKQLLVIQPYLKHVIKNRDTRQLLEGMIDIIIEGRR